MKLTIYGYGHPVLKQVATDITPEYPALNTLIENMWDTMYHAEGVGIAAPQVGLSIRLFVIDTIQLDEKRKTETGMKQVFINAKIVEESGKKWDYEEGCLSIPGVRGKVNRLDTIHIKYQDADFNWHEQTFDGINARVIQHEYDHIEGKLFVEKLEPARKLILKNKLESIKRGKVDVDYKMKFATGRV
jgi:peptide deformylase